MFHINITLIDKKEAPSFLAHIGRQMGLGYYRGLWEDGSKWEVLEEKE